MKFTIFLFLLSFLFQFSEAQKVTVADANTGSPVEGVLIMSARLTVQTDSLGRANLDSFSGREILHFQHPSYDDLRTDKIRIAQKQYSVLLVLKPLKLEEVVVSVARRAGSMPGIPNKLLLIGHENVLRLQPQTTADLLVSNGEVFVQKSQQGGGSPMMRGFSANRLLLVVDGIRMNNALFRSGNLQNVVSLDANMIEASEVSLGPGSVTYGSDALGGVLNFSTFKPRLSTGKEWLSGHSFKTGYSSANFAKTIHGRVGFGRQKWGTLISGTYSDFDNLKMGSAGPDEYLRKEYAVSGYFNGVDSVVRNKDPRYQVYSGYHQLNLMSKFRFMPSPKIDINLGYHFSATGNVPRYDRLIVYRGGKLRYGDWYYGPQKWTMLSGQLEWLANSPVFDRLTVISGYQRFAESRLDRNLNSSVLFHREETVTAGTLTLDFIKSAGEKVSLMYGLEFAHNLVGSSGESEDLLTLMVMPVNPRYPDGSTYRTKAFYMSGRIGIHPDVTFNSGIRFTATRINGMFDSRFYNFPIDGFHSANRALNGNAGFTWKPATAWKVNLVASSGFRSPNIDDMAKVFDSEPGNVIVPNTALKPEYAYNLEFRILRSLYSRSKLEFSVFNTWLTNAMVRRDFTFNGSDSILYNGINSKVEALVNADNARISGASLLFDYPLGNRLLFKSNFTYIRGKDSDGNALRHIPPAFGTSGLAFNSEKWGAEINTNYNGSISFSRLAPDERSKDYLYLKDEKGNPYSPSWWTLNFVSVWHLSEHWKISFGLENMLNKRYRPYSSGIVAGGRSISISALLQL
jgi:hemoglobin/transferrin/lactoferrin receptor protein